LTDQVTGNGSPEVSCAAIRYRLYHNSDAGVSSHHGQLVADHTRVCSCGRYATLIYDSFLFIDVKIRYRDAYNVFKNLNIFLNVFIRKTLEQNVTQNSVLVIFFIVRYVSYNK